MGLTKRVGEMLIQNINGSTQFISVRFGNVLGSAGSVVPLFQKQIEEGGPVTVTHREATRYFMTAPEAISLVIQAGAMGKGGEVLVLDMGEPVKIIDLAKDLIMLAGLVPDKDIEIKFIGLRPGEKLHEELLTKEETTTTTYHKQIFIVKPDIINPSILEEKINALLSLSEKGNREKIIQQLRELVPR
jgi:FlaA1/EpsC-like NDP-sugar epimerase